MYEDEKSNCLFIVEQNRQSYILLSLRFAFHTFPFEEEISTCTVGLFSDKIFFCTLFTILFTQSIKKINKKVSLQKLILDIIFFGFKILALFSGNQKLQNPQRPLVKFQKRKKNVPTLIKKFTFVCASLVMMYLHHYIHTQTYFI